MSGTPSFLKRLEARIAIALARAEAAAAAAASGSNHSDTVLAFSTPPGNPVTLAAPVFTPASGKVRVLVFVTASANGGTMAAGDVAGMLITRDGIPIPAATPAGATQGVEAHGPALGLSMALGADDSVTPNTPHVWAVQLNCSNAHTISMVGGSSSIIVQELAG